MWEHLLQLTTRDLVSLALLAGGVNWGANFMQQVGWDGTLSFFLSFFLPHACSPADCGWPHADCRSRARGRALRERPPPSPPQVTTRILGAPLVATFLAMRLVAAVAGSGAPPASAGEGWGGRSGAGEDGRGWRGAGGAGDPGAHPQNGLVP